MMLYFGQLIDLIVEDHLIPNMQVPMGSGSSRRVVVLNSFDPQTGQPVNQVKDAPLKTGMADLPNTPAFKMQEQQAIATMITALAANPNAVNILTPAYIESSTLPNRNQIADDLRKATGVPTAGDRQAAQQNQQAMAQAQQTQQQLQQRAAVAQVQKTEADTERTLALAQREKAQAAMIQRDAITEPASNEDSVIQDALREAASA